MVSFLYGLELGAGFLTLISSGAFYVLALGVLTYAHPIQSMAAFGVFGLARALPVLLLGWHLRSHSGEQLSEFILNFERDNRIHLVIGALLVLIGSYYWLSIL